MSCKNTASCRNEHSVPASNYLTALVLGLSFMHANFVFGGTVLFDTTNLAPGPWQIVGFIPSADLINQPAGSFFITGGDYLLESVTVQLRRSELQSGGTPDNYQVRIWNDESGLPGNLLESIEVPDSATPLGLISLESIIRPQLENNGTYWVSVALPDDMSEGGWRASNLLDSPPSNSAIALNGSTSSDWHPSVSNTRSYVFSISGTPIPEPHAACLAMFGIVLWSACRNPRIVSK